MLMLQTLSIEHFGARNGATAGSRRVNRHSGSERSGGPTRDAISASLILGDLVGIAMLRQPALG
jgi:hypothetical protein